MTFQSAMNDAVLEHMLKKVQVSHLIEQNKSQIWVDIFYTLNHRVDCNKEAISNIRGQCMVPRFKALEN